METATFSPTHTHPHPQANPHHRKIDLQSPADLLYLQSNLSASATAKLNLHFPPKHAYATHIPLSPSSSQPQDATKTQPQPASDPLRARVESLVSTFLSETWSSAAHSIRVNGLDASSLYPSSSLPSQTAPSTTEIEGQHFTYTPYDPSLLARATALHAELEALTNEVSRLRRGAPREAAEGYIATLQNALEEDEGVYTSEREDAARTPEGVLKVESIPKGAEELYERGLGELVGLSGLSSKAGAGQGGKKQGTLSLTETVGKVQRARRVVGELE